MRIFIYAARHAIAEHIAHEMELRAHAWQFLRDDHQLRGMDGFVVIRDTVTSSEHPRRHELDEMIEQLEQRGRLIVWKISIDWMYQRFHGTRAPNDRPI